ncbi:chromate transporter [Candidatus Oleimmundimicrobium sp.]|uniref:chromate transporter n=1 Tax=Candidatus Oleimmundimicrobium sp. TaxID=3060597 RepID=UPI00271CDA7D|nr:chromate transporter [Candidatus Oleimmundimicrobium sp.]MDO8886247.1 chromate transporter [Candidatus Oleimmundimicrobium sp.]
MDIKLKDIFKSFFKIGLGAFGGMVAIAHIEETLVKKKKMISRNQFNEGLALAQIVPGSTSTSLVVYIGYNLGGLSGAIIAISAFILPAFTLMIFLAIGYLHFQEVSFISSILRGLNAVVVALIIDALVNLSKSTIKRKREAVIALFTFFALYFLKTNLFLLIFLAGMLGLIFYVLEEKPCPPANKS